MGALPPVEHYVDGRRVYTLAQAASLLGESVNAIRLRVSRHHISAAGWINPRLPVYHLHDLRGHAPTGRED